MAKPERNALSTDAAAAAWYRKDLEQVESELLAVVRSHLPRVGTQLTAHAIIEFAGSVLGDIVAADPAAALDVDEKLGALRLFVKTTVERPQ